MCVLSNRPFDASLACPELTSYSGVHWDGYDDWKREAVASLPPGSKTVCFVNPDDPSEAVIRRGFGSPESPAGHVFLWVVSVGLMVLGLLGFGLTLICYAPVNPLEVIFNKLLQNTMAACMAILGTVCVEAGEDFSNDLAIHPQYLARAISLLADELDNKPQAEAIVAAAGWA
jgi:hypothetical protein